MKWILAVAAVLCLAIPTQAQEVKSNWITMTSVDWIVGGADEGELWYDGGSLRRLGTTGKVSVYALLQAAKPSPDKAAAVGGSLVVRDEFSKWVSGIAQIGLVNNLAGDQYGWVSSVGLHVGVPGHIFGLAISGGPYEVEDGKINGWKIGLAPTIQIDAAVEWLAGN